MKYAYTDIVRASVVPGLMALTYGVEFLRISLVFRKALYGF